jgi:hypothetical protein
MGEDDDLVITPDRELSDIVIRGNEILIGNVGFRKKWQWPTKYPVNNGNESEETA